MVRNKVTQTILPGYTGTTGPSKFLSGAGNWMRKDVNPMSENIARFLYQELGKRLNSDGVKVSRVKVCETPGAGAFYWEE